MANGNRNTSADRRGNDRGGSARVAAFVSVICFVGGAAAFSAWALGASSPQSKQAAATKPAGDGARLADRDASPAAIAPKEMAYFGDPGDECGDAIGLVINGPVVRFDNNGATNESPAPPSGCGTDALADNNGLDQTPGEGSVRRSCPNVQDLERAADADPLRVRATAQRTLLPGREPGLHRQDPADDVGDCVGFAWGLPLELDAVARVCHGISERSWRAAARSTVPCPSVRRS